jgi:hypothetical protein
MREQRPLNAHQPPMNIGVCYGLGAVDISLFLRVSQIYNTYKINSANVSTLMAFLSIPFLNEEF